MKRININNGIGPDCTPKEALSQYSLYTISLYMDDDTRDEVCRECYVENAEEFIEEYLKRAPCDLIIG